jgi:hypothetical protein
VILGSFLVEQGVRGEQYPTKGHLLFARHQLWIPWLGYRVSPSNSPVLLYTLELPLQTPHLFPLCTAKMPTTNDQFDKSFLDADINQLVKQLTMDEKVSLLAGSGWWETVSVPRKNIPR